MSKDVIEYLTLLSSAISDVDLNRLVAQRLALIEESVNLSTLVMENRLEFRTIPPTDKRFDKFNDEMLSLSRQYSSLQRASCDLDSAIYNWMDNAPGDVLNKIKDIQSRCRGSYGFSIPD